MIKASNNSKPKLRLPASFSLAILASLVLQFGAFQPAGAQTGDPLLDSLIAVSSSRHPDLGSMQAMIEAAEARQRMKRSLMNPSLTLGVMDLPTSLKYDEDPATAFRIGAMQRIPWPGKRRAAGNAAGSRVDESRFQFDIARQKMAAMVAMEYYDLAAFIATDSLLNEGLELTREMTRAATLMTRSAMGRQSDIERARLEEEYWKLKIIANRGEIERRRAALAYALAIPPDSTLFGRLNLPEGLPTLPNLDSLLTGDAVDGSPSVALVRQELESAERDLKRARLNWFPDLDIEAAYDLKPDLKTAGGHDPMTGQDVPPGSTDQMNMITLMVSGTVPLFSRGNQRAEIAETTAMRRSAEADLADERLSIEREIRRLHASWKEQNDCCVFVRESLIGRAEALYKTALIDYQSGNTPFMELSQARMSVVMAKMELAMSRAQAWEYRAELLATLGKLAENKKEHLDE